MVRMLARNFVPLAATLVVLWAVPAAVAQIDLTGDYRVDWVEAIPDVCTATIVQTGTSLTYDASCIGGNFQTATGTIDTVTGDFTLSGTCDESAPPPGPPGPFLYSGTGSQDSLTFTMNGTCQGTAAVFFGTKCGNGTADANEECEDGNRDDGDCCSSSCTAETGNVCSAASPVCTFATCDSSGACVAGAVSEPAGTACDLDADLCTEDVCDGAGSCATTGLAVTCGACGICESATGCTGDPSPYAEDPGPGECWHLIQHRDKGRMRNDLNNNDKDKLVWKWKNGPAMPPTEFGSPTSTTDYTLCVFDHEDSRVLADLDIPAGAGWSASPGGFKHKSNVPGVGKVKVRLIANASKNKSKITVSAKGPALGYPDVFEREGGLTQGLHFELRASNGKCWVSEGFGVDYKSSPSAQRLKLD